MRVNIKRPVLFVVLLVAFTASAFADQSSLDQALSAKLMSEINSGLQCSTNLLDLQKQLDAAKKEIADLKAQKDQPK